MSPRHSQADPGRSSQRVSEQLVPGAALLYSSPCVSNGGSAMRYDLRLLAGSLAFGLMLSGCGGGQRAPAPARTASRPATPAPVRPAIAPADYVASASALDLYVIKASELALQRSQARRVREVAERLIAAHRGSSAQLSLNGRRLNLLPSATVGPRLQALLERQLRPRLRRANEARRAGGSHAAPLLCRGGRQPDADPGRPCACADHGAAAAAGFLSLAREMRPPRT
jgi:predicted outer membrane protein